MRVPGKLQRDARSLSNFRMVGSMHQQNTRRSRSNPMLSKANANFPPRRSIRHAENLQSVYFHLLAAQHAHPRRRMAWRYLASSPNCS